MRRHIYHRRTARNRKSAAWETTSCLPILHSGRMTVWQVICPGKFQSYKRSGKQTWTLTDGAASLTSVLGNQFAYGNCSLFDRTAADLVWKITAWQAVWETNLHFDWWWRQSDKRSGKLICLQKLHFDRSYRHRFSLENSSLTTGLGKVVCILIGGAASNLF